MKTIELNSHTTLLVDEIDGISTEENMLKVVSNGHMFIVNFDSADKAGKGYDILKIIVKRKQYPDNWTVWDSPTLKGYINKEVNND